MTSKTLKIAAACLPFLATLVFVWRFATPTPLTDEWLLVFNAMIIQLASFKNIVPILGAIGWRINDHPLVLPNLIYLTVGPWFGFDSRAMVALTVACFGAVSLALLRAGVSAVAVLLAAFILASPAHYMEFQWGFQFTLTLSIWLPVIGLIVLDRGTRDGRIDPAAARVFVTLTTLGILSSAPAAFSLIAAIALIALKPLPRREKAVSMVALAATFVAIALVLRTIGGGGGDASPAPVAPFVLTAIGAVLLSSPVVLSDFGLDARSIAGMALVVAVLAPGLVLAGMGRISALALPAALGLYGLTMLTAVAINRGYLGNWHIQLAIPVALAAILLADRAWSDGRAAGRVTSAIVFAIIACGLAGAWYGFATGGPAHAEYARNVTDYMRNIHNKPPGKPFPGNWEVKPEMVDFLRKKGNPSFADPN